MTTTVTRAASVDRDQAHAIAEVLQDAGMSITVQSIDGRPVWVGCTSGEFLAAVMYLGRAGFDAALLDADWLTVMFEQRETRVSGRPAFGSLELGWAADGRA